MSSPIRVQLFNAPMPACKMVFAPGGAIAPDHYTPTEWKRLEILQEFGHRVCLCLKDFFSVRAYLASHTGQETTLRWSEVGIVRGALQGREGRRYRRWRARHRVDMERVGSGYVKPRGVEDESVVQQLFHELNARGHDARWAHPAVSVFNLSLGCVLPAVRVHLESLDYTSWNSKGNEKIVVGKQVPLPIRLYAGSTQPISKRAANNLLWAVRCIERLTFAEYIRNNTYEPQAAPVQRLTERAEGGEQEAPSPGPPVPQGVGGALAGRR